MLPSKLTRREFIGWAAASAAGGAAWLSACKRAASAKVVRFLNWAGYIAPETLPRFERETGVMVVNGFYASEEGMLAKVSAPGAVYDVVIAPDHAIPTLKSQGLIAAIPHGRLKNLAHVAPDYRDPAYDRGMSHSVPYLWGTTGVGVNTSRFPQRPVSWRALWDERYKGRISMLDNAREALQCALLLSGLPLDSRDPAQLAQARDLLLRQRPLVKMYDSSRYAEELDSGRLWLSQAWSGDILRLASRGGKVDFTLPREGSFIWMDNVCLRRGAEENEHVLRFVDYLLRPDVAAEIAEATWYGTPNAQARALLKPALRDDPRVYPSLETRARLRFSAPLDPQAEKLWSRTWEEVQG